MHKQWQQQIPFYIAGTLSPTEQAALKCLYLVVRSLDPTGRGRKRWITRWKPALNAFAITFEGRIFPTNQ